MDDVYRDRQDPAVTVGLRLRVGPRARTWTARTPWSGRRRRGRCRRTWPSRCTRTSSTSWSRRLTPRRTRRAVRPRRGPAGRVRARAGRRRRACCAGSPAPSCSAPRYIPPFDFFAGRENAHRVLAADYVTTDDGTGLVHIAPAFGEEDKVVTDAAGIEAVVPVDTARRVRRARCRRTRACTCSTRTPQIIRDLRNGAPQALLLRHETYDHPYPHCWRCGNPLIQRAVDSWFVAGDAVPRPDGGAEPADHLGARAHPRRPVRQVAGGRARLVDLPQPVLGLADPGVGLATTRAYPRTDVYGSLDELERDFGVRPDGPAPARTSTS